MGQSKAPAWTFEEIAVLDEIYPREGLNGVTDLLPERSWAAIHQMAHKRGLRAAIVSSAPRPALKGADLDEAIRLREEDGWSFARIGARFGVAEASACNAVLIALCPRKGFVPAPRDANGRLLPEGHERLRLALKRGMKGVDIQLQLGISASRIAEERRRYRADLKARGKAALPPPGAGEAYSGVKLPAAKKREVEQLLLEGFGAKKVTERTGTSNTSVGRIRNRLIKRLRRRGETLPGCDLQGRRLSAPKESAHFIPTSAIEELRRRILNREPVMRAARDLGIGGSRGYMIRDVLAAEFAERGEQLLPPLRTTRAEAQREHRKASWLPKPKWSRYRALTLEHGPIEAKRLLLIEIGAERRAEAARPKSFEEQLARAARGEARVVANIPLRRPDPLMTLGGVATGAL